MQNKNLAKILNAKELSKWIKLFIWLIVLYFVFSAVIVFVPFFATKDHFVIVSNSMHPIISRGDIVVVNNNFNENDLQVDNIIAFNIDLNDDGKKETIVHYIADIQTNEQDEKTYYTKRANTEHTFQWDNWQLSIEDIVGTYSFKIPRLGRLVLFSQSNFGKLIIILDIILVFSVLDYFDKTNKNKKRDEDETT